MKLGLHANIYSNRKWEKEGYDTTNGGMSRDVTGVIVVDPRIDPVFAPSIEFPAVKIVERPHLNYIHAEPLIPDDFPLKGFWERRCHWSSGGNFIYTSDSRLTRISSYPIPLHDRNEGRHNYWLAHQLWYYPYHKLQDWTRAIGCDSVHPDVMNGFRTRLFAFYVRRADHSLRTVEDILMAWYNTHAPRAHAINRWVTIEDSNGRMDYLMNVCYPLMNRIVDPRYCGDDKCATYNLAERTMRQQQRG